jgi:hypothetical protein
MFWGLLGVGAGVCAPAMVALAIAPKIPALIMGATPASAVCGLLLMGWMFRHTDAKGRFGKTRAWIVGRALLIGFAASAGVATLMAVTFAPGPALSFFFVVAAVTLPSAVLGGIAAAFIALKTKA